MSSFVPSKDCRRVAALFTCATSHYHDLEDVDCYGVAEDAYTYDGPFPVVAHPPCALWGRLRRQARGDRRELFSAVFAVQCVRTFGGVLEHPAHSKLWEFCGLPAPGERRDREFTLGCAQYWFGFPARKDTWLFTVGVREFPEMPYRLEGDVRAVDSMDGGGEERYRTTREMAEWLVAVARASLLS